MAQTRHYVPRDYNHSKYGKYTGGRNYTSSRKHTTGRKKRSRRRPLVFIAAVALILCVAAVITMVLIYKDVHLQYCVELGDPLPPAQVFAKSDSVAVNYITDISGIDGSEPGSNWIHVSVNGTDRLVNLVIRDTIPPEAQPVEMVISIKEEVTPDQLVSDLNDAGLLKLNWNKKPEFGKVGDYPVVVSVQDMGGNTTSVNSVVHIRTVLDELVYEAGGNLPGIKDFLVDDTLNARFVTGIESLPLSTPGTYDVSIDIDGTAYASKLVVKDTVAPDVTWHMVHITPGEQASAEDFVLSAVDASALSFKLTAEPDYNKAGAQEVGIIATDMGGNSAEGTAVLVISNVPPITVEVRNTPLTANEFTVAGSHNSVSLAEQMTPNIVGEYDVEVIVNGQANHTIVKVVDTIPPKAEPKNVEGYLNKPITPEHFVKNAFDYTEITYSFSEEPDWTKEGDQSVNVRLTDTSGNWVECKCALTLKKDTQAPILYGVKDRFGYIGEAVSYFAEVFAEDNCDSEVKIDVDSDVNINAAGKYKVTYTATDSSGNIAEKSCSFTLVEETISDDKLHQEAQSVLDDIINDNMSIGEKAKAVFDYVQQRIKYQGSSRKDDWKYEAYRGFTAGRGDCFTYFATAKSLLLELGIETMDVERYGGNRTTRHYWMLVNLGTGWYHFDAIDVGPGGYKCFMKTDEEVIAVDPNFYSWNHSLYPPTPNERYKMN